MSFTFRVQQTSAPTGLGDSTEAIQTPEIDGAVAESAPAEGSAGSFTTEALSGELGGILPGEFVDTPSVAEGSSGDGGSIAGTLGDLVDAAIADPVLVDFGVDLSGFDPDAPVLPGPIFSGFDVDLPAAFEGDTGATSFSYDPKLSPYIFATINQLNTTEGELDVTRAKILQASMAAQTVNARLGFPEGYYDGLARDAGTGVDEFPVAQDSPAQLAIAVQARLSKLRNQRDATSLAGVFFRQSTSRSQQETSLRRCGYTNDEIRNGIITDTKGIMTLMDDAVQTAFVANLYPWAGAQADSVSRTTTPALQTWDTDAGRNPNDPSTLRLEDRTRATSASPLLNLNYFPRGGSLGDVDPYDRWSQFSLPLQGNILASRAEDFPGATYSLSDSETYAINRISNDLPRIFGSIDGLPVGASPPRYANGLSVARRRLARAGFSFTDNIPAITFNAPLDRSLFVAELLRRELLRSSNSNLGRYPDGAASALGLTDRTTGPGFGIGVVQRLSGGLTSPFTEDGRISTDLYTNTLGASSTYLSNLKEPLEFPDGTTVSTLLFESRDIVVSEEDGSSDRFASFLSVLEDYALKRPNTPSLSVLQDFVNRSAGELESLGTFISQLYSTAGTSGEVFGRPFLASSGWYGSLDALSTRSAGQTGWIATFRPVIPEVSMGTTVPVGSLNLLDSEVIDGTPGRNARSFFDLACLSFFDAAYVGFRSSVSLKKSFERFATFAILAMAGRDTGRGSSGIEALVNDRFRGDLVDSFSGVDSDLGALASNLFSMTYACDDLSNRLEEPLTRRRAGVSFEIADIEGSTTEDDRLLFVRELGVLEAEPNATSVLHSTLSTYSGLCFAALKHHLSVSPDGFVEGASLNPVRLAYEIFKEIGDRLGRTVTDLSPFSAIGNTLFAGLSVEAIAGLCVNIAAGIFENRLYADGVSKIQAFKIRPDGGPTNIEFSSYVEGGPKSAFAAPLRELIDTNVLEGIDFEGNDREIESCWRSLLVLASETRVALNTAESIRTSAAGPALQAVYDSAAAGSEFSNKIVSSISSGYASNLAVFGTGAATGARGSLATYPGSSVAAGCTYKEAGHAANILYDAVQNIAKSDTDTSRIRVQCIGMPNGFSERLLRLPIDVTDVRKSSEIFGRISSGDALLADVLVTKQDSRVPFLLLEPIKFPVLVNMRVNLTAKPDSPLPLADIGSYRTSVSGTGIERFFRLVDRAFQFRLIRFDLATGRSVAGYDALPIVRRAISAGDNRLLDAIFTATLSRLIEIQNVAQSSFDINSCFVNSDSKFDEEVLAVPRSGDFLLTRDRLINELVDSSGFEVTSTYAGGRGQEFGIRFQAATVPAAPNPTLSPVVELAGSMANVRFTSVSHNMRAISPKAFDVTYALPIDVLSGRPSFYDGDFLAYDGASPAFKQRADLPSGISPARQRTSEGAEPAFNVIEGSEVITSYRGNSSSNDTGFTTLTAQIDLSNLATSEIA